MMASDVVNVNVVKETLLMLVDIKIWPIYNMKNVQALLHIILTEIVNDTFKAKQ